MCFKEKYVRGERDRVEDVDPTAVESESEDILEEVPAATRPPPMTTEPSFHEFMARRGWMTTTPTRAFTSAVVSDRRNATGGDEVAPAAVTRAAQRQLHEQAAIGLRRRRLAVLRQSPDIGDVGRSLLTERDWNTMTDALLADAVSWPPQIEETRRDLTILTRAREDARRMNQSEPADAGVFMEVMEQRLHNHLEDAAQAWYLLLSARSSGFGFSEARTDLDMRGVGTTGGLTQQEGSVANREGDSSNVWFRGAAHLSHPDAVASVRVVTTLEELLHLELQHVEFPPATIVCHPDAEISGRVVTTLQELIDPANLRDQRNIQRRVETFDTGVLRAQREAEQAASGLLQTRESLAGRLRQRGRAAVGELLQIAAERSVRSGETRQATVEPTLAAVAEDQRLGQPEAQRQDTAQGAQTTTQRWGRANRPMQQRQRRRPDPAGVAVSSPQGREQEDRGDIEHRLGMSLGNLTAEIALNYEQARSMRNSASGLQQQLALGQGEVSHFPDGQPRPGAGGHEDEDADMVSREESYYSTAEGGIAEESAVRSNQGHPYAIEQGRSTAPGQTVSEQSVDSDDPMQFAGVVDEAARSADHGAASAQNHDPDDNAAAWDNMLCPITPRPASRSSRRLLRWVAFETQERPKWPKICHERNCKNRSEHHDDAKALFQAKELQHGADATLDDLDNDTATFLVRFNACGHFNVIMLEQPTETPALGWFTRCSCKIPLSGEMVLAFPVRRTAQSREKCLLCHPSNSRKRYFSRSARRIEAGDIHKWQGEVPEAN